MGSALSDKIEIKVRFSEVDSMKVVWHGHYLKYFEDGRESFGKKFGIGYLDFYSNGILVPLVNIEVSFKRFLKLGEHAYVETNYIDSKAAKLIYEYTIYSSKNNEVIATCRSVQAFLDLNSELMLSIPPFFLDWKRKHKLIK